MSLAAARALVAGALLCAPVDRYTTTAGRVVKSLGAARGAVPSGSLAGWLLFRLLPRGCNSSSNFGSFLYSVVHYFQLCQFKAQEALVVCVCPINRIIYGVGSAKLPF